MSPATLTSLPDRLSQAGQRRLLAVLDSPLGLLALGAALVLGIGLALPPLSTLALGAALLVVGVAQFWSGLAYAQCLALGGTVFLMLQPLLRERFGARFGLMDEVIALAILAGLLLFGLIRPRQPFGGALGLFFVLHLLLSLGSAMLNEVAPVVALLGIFATFKSMTGYYLGFNLRPEGRALVFYQWVFLLAGGLAAWLAVLQFHDPKHPALQYVLNPEVTKGAGARATGLFSHPKELGQFLALLFCLGFARLLVRGWRDFYAHLALAASGVGLLYAKTRSTWVVVCVLAVQGCAARWPRLMPLLLAPMVLVAGILPTIPIPPKYSYRMDGLRIGLQSLWTGEFRGNFEWRFYNVYMTSQVLGDHPLLGVGPGRWGSFTAKSRDQSVYQAYEMKEFIVSKLAGLDMDWLRTFGEGGWLLATLWLLAFAAAWSLSLWGYQSFTDPWQRSFALAVWLFNTAVFMESFSSQLLEAPFISFYFWGFNGVVAGWAVAWRAESTASRSAGEATAPSPAPGAATAHADGPPPGCAAR